MPDADPAPEPASAPPRTRLLHAALQLFAHQGYARTSIRELAEAAGTNLAAIKYYYGDKAGLYRAAFFVLQPPPEQEIARYAAPGLSLAEALRGLYQGFVEPLRQGEWAMLNMRLQMREILEPTGLWDETMQQGLRPMHEALVQLLCRHVGLAAPDDDLQRLAMAVAALGMQLHVGHDLAQLTAPQLYHADGALDQWLDRLVMYAEAMVAAELRRRAAG